MKIVKVEYRRLVSDGNYNNESHGAEAIVEDGEDPICAHADLISWVDDILRKRGYLRDEERKLEYDVQSLRMQEGKLRRECDKYRRTIEKMVDFLNNHGVKIPTDEIPF